jgi:hypothetical protein
MQPSSPKWSTALENEMTPVETIQNLEAAERAAVCLVSFFPGLCKRAAPCHLRVSSELN